MTKRVGIYLRVSTGHQTVENQRIDLQRVAEQRGWKVVTEYVDEGITGSKGRDKRPAFDRLCKDASHGKLDVVAAWALDRVARSLSDAAAFMTELAAQKVALYLHQQQVDGTTPAGRAMLGMAAVFAEFERAMLIERINAGLARARAQGKHLGRPRSPTRNVERQAHELRAKGYGLVRIGRTLKVGTGRIRRLLQDAPP